MLFVDEKWVILLKEKKITCNIDIPFGKSSEANLAMSFRARNLDICNRDVTKLAEKDPKIKYFFWSQTSNSNVKDPMANFSIQSKCYAFKTCIKNDRVRLEFPGTTYKLKESKYYFRVIKAYVMLIEV